jgi:hypothetical protein
MTTVIPDGARLAETCSTDGVSLFGAVQMPMGLGGKYTVIFEPAATCTAGCGTVGTTRSVTSRARGFGFVGAPVVAEGDLIVADVVGAVDAGGELVAVDAAVGEVVDCGLIEVAPVKGDGAAGVGARDAHPLIIARSSGAVAAARSG